MANRPWKAEERRPAALFGGQRFAANTGGAVDFETSRYVGQVKHVRRLSLAALEALALEMERLGFRKRPRKCGVVVVERRAGKLADEFFTVGARVTRNENPVGIMIAGFQEFLGTWTADLVEDRKTSSTRQGLPRAPAR